MTSTRKPWEPSLTVEVGDFVEGFCQIVGLRFSGIVARVVDGGLYLVDGGIHGFPTNYVTSVTR